MRNHRFAAVMLAGSALSLALIAAGTGAASAREYNGERSWNGQSRAEAGSTNTRRGTAANQRGGTSSKPRNDDWSRPVVVQRDRDRDWNGNRDWRRGNDRWQGDWNGRRYGGGRYNPWWGRSRYADDYYGFDRPRWQRRHWWNRYQ